MSDTTDFDQAADHLATQLARHTLTGVYGVPRGGLCLAVALSHRLDMPLLHAPRPGCAVVDDFADTGSTLSQIWPHGCVLAVWVTRDIPSRRWIHARLLDDGSNPAFPWEDDAPVG